MIALSVVTHNYWDISPNMCSGDEYILKFGESTSGDWACVRASLGVCQNKVKAGYASAIYRHTPTTACVYHHNGDRVVSPVSRRSSFVWQPHFAFVWPPNEAAAWEQGQGWKCVSTITVHVHSLSLGQWVGPPRTVLWGRWDRLGAAGRSRRPPVSGRWAAPPDHAGQSTSNSPQPSGTSAGDLNSKNWILRWRRKCINSKHFSICLLQFGNVLYFTTNVCGMYITWSVALDISLVLHYTKQIQLYSYL